MKAQTDQIAVQVDRAAHEFRRGRAVRLDSGAGSCVLALAAETLSEAALAELEARAASGQVYLALTARRAAVLHILPTGDDTILLPLADLPVAAGQRAALIRELADASRDLAAPMRGPFRHRRGTAPDYARAAIKLAKVAYLLPAAVVAEIADVAPGGGDGDALAADVDAVLGFDAAAADSLRQVSHARLPVADAEESRLYAFRAADGSAEHFALVIGHPDPQQPVLTRLHSECFTGDLLASMRCDCGEQLRGAVRAIEAAGGGVLLYMAQEGRGIGLVNKLRAYQLQDQGFDTIEANQRLGFGADERWFRPAARMLRLLGFSAVRLLTNNPEKVQGLAAEGIQVTERVAHRFAPNSHNEAYLATKKKRSGHYL